MRNFALGMLSMILLLMTILVMSTVYGRSARQNELELALNSSMNHALESLNKERSEAPLTEDEFVAFFIEDFVTQINSVSDVSIEVLDLDIPKRLFSVKATLKYNHLNGRLGTVSSTKTIVLEQFRNDDAIMAVEFVWSGTNPSGDPESYSTEYYIANKENLKAQHDSASYILTSVVVSTDERTSNHVVFKDASDNDITLTVGTAYTSDYINSLKVSDAKLYTNVVFTKN